MPTGKVGADGALAWHVSTTSTLTGGSRLQIHSHLCTKGALSLVQSTSESALYFVWVCGSIWGAWKGQKLKWHTIQALTIRGWHMALYEAILYCTAPRVTANN